MLAIPWVVSLLSGAKSIFTNKYVLIALGVILLSVGSYFLYEHEINTHVATAVKKDDDTATIKTQGTALQTTQAAATIDHKYDQKAATTQQEYDHVRTIVVSSPTASNAADPLLISTLNALAGMHGGSYPVGVSDSPD